MKSVLAIAVGLASLSMASAGEMSVRYESRTETKCVTDANGKTTCVPVTTVVPVVFEVRPATSAVNFVTVPRGMHAHKMADGSTMIHGDENHNNAAAHVGVVGIGWPKTATAGQLVQVSATSDACPTGTCPTSTSSVSSARTRETIFARGRLFSRLFTGRLVRAFGGGCP